MSVSPCESAAQSSPPKNPAILEIILVGLVLSALPRDVSGAMLSPDESTATNLTVAFNAPGKGLLSLGVYDSSGTLIRSLAFAKTVEAGPQSLSWDGTSDLGLPAAPGTYRAQGVWFSGGPRVDYHPPRS